MANAYIYIRYSDPRQRLGSSYERQVEKARTYCAKKGLTFRDEHIFLGDGVSAFKNEHIAEGGKLRELYDLIDDGTIAPGSYLLVENMDRLSRRDYMEAGQKFLDLTNKGIVIVTLMNEREYRQGVGIGDTLTAFVEMDTAHRESAKKSERVAQSWKVRAKEASQGKRIKLPLASWLTYDDDDQSKYKLIPDKAETVRRIYQWCADGRGVTTIAKLLNDEGVPPFRSTRVSKPSTRWISASVYNILRNTTTKGTYTPDRARRPDERSAVVPNYFPAAVSEELFYAAQAALAQRAKAKATNQSAVFNIWQGIAKCSLCGSALHCVPKGAKSLRYLVCSGKISGVCADAKNVRADAAEEIFKELLIKVDALSLVHADVQAVEANIRTLDAKLLEQRKQLADLKKALGNRFAQTLVDLVFEIEDSITTLAAERTKLEQAKAVEYERTTDKAYLLERISLESFDERNRANALLKRLAIEVAVTGSETPNFEAYIGWKKYPIHPPFQIPAAEEELALTFRNAILQLVWTKQGVVLVPRNDEQRQRFREQDTDGSDHERSQQWIREKLFGSKKGIK